MVAQLAARLPRSIRRRSKRCFAGDSAINVKAAGAFERKSPLFLCKHIPPRRYAHVHNITKVQSETVTCEQAGTGLSCVTKLGEEICLRQLRQLISPNDKGKPVREAGTQSLGFSLRSAQAAEEERHRLVHAGTVAFPGVRNASSVSASFVVP